MTLKYAMVQPNFTFSFWPVFLFLSFEFASVDSFSVITNRYFIVNPSSSSFTKDVRLKHQNFEVEQAHNINSQELSLPSFVNLVTTPYVNSHTSKSIVVSQNEKTIFHRTHPSIIPHGVPVRIDSENSHIITYPRRMTSTTRASITTAKYPRPFSTQINHLPLNNNIISAEGTMSNSQQQIRFASKTTSTSPTAVPSPSYSIVNTTNDSITISFKEIINAPEFKCPGDQKKDEFGKCRDIYYS